MALPSYGRSAYRLYGDSSSGNNPFLDPTRRIAELIGRLSNSGSAAQNYVARPGDSEVRDYMSNVLGGQRNTLDDYVRRAAGTGVKRGGFNTAGGAPLDSALYKQAIESLARGYGDRFRDAMNYNKYVKATESSQSSDNIRNLQNLLGLQQRYLSSSADWQQRFTSPTPAPANRDDSQDSALKELALERLRRQMETEQWRTTAEKEDRQRALDEKTANEEKWAQLMQKAALAYQVGRSGANWTAQDDALENLLGVKLGYQLPWQRKLDIYRRM